MFSTSALSVWKAKQSTPHHFTDPFYPQDAALFSPRIVVLVISLMQDVAAIRIDAFCSSQLLDAAKFWSLFPHSAP
jgi:hypothetical protein